MNEDKRRQIVEGVWAVIADGGIASVSVRSVAQAAGVSAGRVQHYFPSKVQLVRASVDAMLEGAEAAHPDATGDAAAPATLVALLTHPIEAAATSRAGTSVFYAYVAAGVGDPWIAERLADAKSGVVTAVARCVGVQAPWVPDPDRAAISLVCLSDGATQAVYLGFSTREAAVDAVLSAVAALVDPSESDTDGEA